MAMTKAERERMAELEVALREALALRWTDLVTPDIPKPGYQEKTSGFVFNAYSSDVRPAWSSSAYHGIGYSSEEEQRASRLSARQQGIPLFSTRLLALRGLRHELECEAAKRLAAIDAQIEAELHKDEL